MKKLLLLLLVCLSYSIVSAQDTDDLLNKLVEKNVLTQSEADELRKSSSKEQKSTFSQTTEKVRNIFNSPYIQIGGNGQLMYQYTDGKRVHNDFKAKNLFLSVNGRLNESFRYGFLLEMTNPSVQEFWAEWTAATEFNLKVGQFKSPFTLESQLVPATLETAAYSRTIANLVGYAGEDDTMKKQNNKNNFGRDAGIMASGELVSLPAGHNLIQYSVGLFQGTGVTTGEVNNTKDLAAMILFQPVKGLRVGGGTYQGEVYYNNVDHVRNRWFVSADYKADCFYARSEWLRANDGGTDKEGMYLLGLYYLVPKKLNALAKFDYYNQNKSVNKEAKDYTVGFNYYFYPQCRIQLNYTYSDYSKKWDLGGANNTVFAQLQIGF
ncbi:porin [Dysgonomonas sp. 25]|uniref:porin n=1 Tax=Dysgonomonas sp. 25 TaxID=2302933 RepID=UPI0013D1F763|nr:porin [Dysgonomonas sp. 25]NDV69466.1 hypothetical protein [Dysgonomonas sp. 25]